jgi:hypothetical protein
MEIRQLRFEFDKTKRKLDRTRESLDLEKERLQTNKEKFEEVTSVIDVINQNRKEHADFIVEMAKLEVQLESLIDKQTGYGVDRTGRPKMDYSLCWNPDSTKYYGDDYNEAIKSAFFKIGERSFSVEKFDGFLRSIRHDGDISFLISFKSLPYLNCHSYKPGWLEKWFNQRNWGEAEAEIKKDYK